MEAAFTWFVSNTWLFDVLIGLMFLVSFGIGVLRGLWKSVFHVGITAILLLLCYFIFAPMLANWLCDSMMSSLSMPDSVTIDGVLLSFGSLRELIYKLGSLPTGPDTFSYVSSSNFIFTLCNAFSMMILSIVVFFLSSAISGILFLPILPLLSRAKKKKIAAGKKYKKHRLLGGAVSLVATLLVLMFMLNASFNVSTIMHDVVGLAESTGALQELLNSGAMTQDVWDTVVSVVNFIFVVRDGGIFFSWLGFDGSFYSFTMVQDGVETSVSLIDGGKLYFKTVLDALSNISSISF